MGASEKPKGGVDYPRNFNEFEAFFENEAACREYVTRIRWPDGFLCPQCDSDEKPWETGRGYFHCQSCNRVVSVTVCHFSLLDYVSIQFTNWVRGGWLEDYQTTFSMVCPLSYLSY